MRTIEDIRREYVDACARLGEHQYNLKVSIPEAIMGLEFRIKELRAEADAVASAPVEAPAAE